MASPTTMNAKSRWTRGPPMPTLKWCCAPPVAAASKSCGNTSGKGTSDSSPVTNASAFAFRRRPRRAADLIMVLTDAMFYTERRQLLNLAEKNRLPSVYWDREFAEDGAFMSFGPSPSDLFHRSATYVDNILKGAKPGDLPVEQPTKFELVINLKTAKALGIDVPATLLAR